MIKGKVFDFVPMKPTPKGVSTNIYYAVFLEGVEVGYILLENYDFKLGRAEIAYKVLKPFRNKGIATKMLKEFVDIVPQYFNLSFFDAKVRSENYSSCKVLEKAGFKERASSNLLDEKRYYFLDTEEELMEKNSEEFVETIDKAIEKLKAEEKW